MSRVSSALVPPPTPSLHRTQAGAGPRAAVGAAAHANVGKGTENQDTYVASASQSGSKCFVGVFDGHGENGGRVSHFVRDCLSKTLFNREEIHSDPKSAMENAYRETAERLERQHGRDAHESGTTALAAYQHRNKLFIANVGDCRAVLGRCDTSRGTTINAVDLTRDHKPGRVDEKQRILALGGKVDQGCFPVAQGGTIRWMKGGPERVMDRQGIGGLAVSRSLGDLALKPYVTAQPEVLERRLDNKDKLLVLGSDGIWDQLSSKEAVEIASRCADPRAAAQEIAETARKRWQIQTQGQVSDDITALVVRLESEGSTITPAGHRDRDRRGDRGSSHGAERGGGGAGGGGGGGGSRHSSGLEEVRSFSRTSTRMRHRNGVSEVTSSGPLSPAQVGNVLNLGSGCGHEDARPSKTLSRSLSEASSTAPARLVTTGRRTSSGFR